MTTRRDRDRDPRPRYEDDERGPRRVERGERRTARDDLEPEERIRRDAPKEPKRARGAESTDPTDLNQFFIDGEGINREVLQKELCRFLGPEARSKPEVYNGVEGYMVKSFRPFTIEMREDLIQISKKYVSERDDTRRRGGRELPYETSDVNRRRDATIGRQDLDRAGRDSDDRHEMYDSYDNYDKYSKRDKYDDDRGALRTGRTPRERPEAYEPRNPREPEVSYPARRDPRDPYASINPTPAYGGTVPAPYREPAGVPYPRGGAYDPNSPPPGYGPTPVPGYPNPGYSVNPRSGNPGNPGNPGAYVYTTEPVGNNTPYAGVSPYTVASAAPSLRQDQRGYSSRDIPEPRYTGYPPPMGRGGDVAMGGMDDDYDDDYPPGPSGQPSRPSYPGTSRDQPPYDRGHSPDIRDAYRPRPPREERRPRPNR